MTNEDLATWLNEKVGLTGVDAVTVNVIRQWVQWGLIPRSHVVGKTAPKGGPQWERSDMTMRRALRLAELRQAKHRRESELVVQAYLNWGHDDFTRVRECLLLEWRRLHKSINRKALTFFGDKNYDDISATKQRAIKNQIGPLAPIFEGTLLQQSDEFYAVIFELTRSGAESSGRASQLVFDALGKLSPVVLGTIRNNSIRFLIDDVIPGTFGEPDEMESSAIELIESANEANWKLARRWTRRIFKFPLLIKRLKRMGLPHNFTPPFFDVFEQLLPQITQPPWSISIFVPMLLVTLKGCGREIDIFNFDSVLYQ